MPGVDLQVVEEERYCRGKPRRLARAELLGRVSQERVVQESDEQHLVNRSEGKKG